MNTVAGAITNVNTVATNIAGVNSFADRYRISSSAPASSLDIGDLYFDTTQNELKVYKSSGWAAAGSTVNGTSARFTYTISGTPNSVTGSDDNGNTLAYDAGYADVYLNGVRLSSADITITSGTSVVFASNLANTDIVDIVAYGTFNVASVNAANIDAGTLNIARLADDSITNAKLDNNSITINGSPVSLGGSVTVGETKPTISSTAFTIAPSVSSTITILGANFSSIPIVQAVKSDTAAVTTASAVAFTNSGSVNATFTLAGGNYKIRLENPDGNAVLTTNNILLVSSAPTFTVAAGSLGTVAAGSSVSITTGATSDSAVTITETTSVLTSNTDTPDTTMNLSLASDGDITGTAPTPTTATTYTFTLQAEDAENQTATREYSITISVGGTGGGQFN
jgi:hypothetical protein